MREVEWETLKWVDWYNNRRLLGPIGYTQPAEAEEAFYANMNKLDMVARKMKKSPSGKPGAVQSVRAGHGLDQPPRRQGARGADVAAAGPGRGSFRRGAGNALGAGDHPSPHDGALPASDAAVCPALGRSGAARCAGADGGRTRLKVQQIDERLRRILLHLE